MLNDVLSILQQDFGFLTSTAIMGQPLMLWLVAGVVFGMIGAYIRGKK